MTPQQPINLGANTDKAKALNDNFKTKFRTNDASLSDLKVSINFK